MQIKLRKNIKLLGGKHNLHYKRFYCNKLDSSLELKIKEKLAKVKQLEKIRLQALNVNKQIAKEKKALLKLESDKILQKQISQDNNKIHRQLIKKEKQRLARDAKKAKLKQKREQKKALRAQQLQKIKDARIAKQNAQKEKAKQLKLDKLIHLNNTKKISVMQKQMLNTRLKEQEQNAFNESLINKTNAFNKLPVSYKKWLENYKKTNQKRVQKMLSSKK